MAQLVSQRKTQIIPILLVEFVTVNFIDYLCKKCNEEPEGAVGAKHG